MNYDPAIGAANGGAIEFMYVDLGCTHRGQDSLAGAALVGLFGICMSEAATGFALYGESHPGGFWDRTRRLALNQSLTPTLAFPLLSPAPATPKAANRSKAARKSTA
jgi:hypothetical protein